MFDEQYQTGSGKWIREFTSFSEFLDKVEKSPYPTSARAHQSDGNTANERWDLNAGYAGALKLARKGWPEGAKKVKDLAEKLYEKLVTRMHRPDVQFDVFGEGGVDMGLFLAGDPECVLDWRENENSEVEGKDQRVIKVVYNVCTSGGIGSEVMVARGVLVAALVDLLETAGKRVEVVLAAINSGSGGARKTNGYDIFLPVKHADQPLQLDQLAYMLAHPACFRRLMFRLMELEPLDIQEKIGVGWGYGMPSDLEPGDPHYGDIYMGGAFLGHSQWKTPEGAEKWLVDKLKEFGVLRKEE